MIILIIHIIVSYMTRIVHWFFMWKMDPMSGCDIRLVFTLPPRDSTLQYKRCAHLWNNFPCIITLMQTVICKAENCITPCTSWTRLLKRSINTFYFSVSVSCHSELCELLVQGPLYKTKHPMYICTEYEQYLLQLI